MSSAGIAQLLFISLPTTIVRFIISVVVDASQSSVWRAWSHILNEVKNRLSPSSANGYSPITVMPKFLSQWIVAAVKHRGPSPVLRCVRPTVSSVHCLSVFSLQAATALRIFMAQIFTTYSNNLSAGAFTLPCYAPPARDQFGLRIANHKQSPELLVKERFSYASH